MDSLGANKIQRYECVTLQTSYRLLKTAFIQLIHCHLMTMIKINKILNSYQICIDAADEAIFALRQELIKRFPDKFGPDKFFPPYREIHSCTGQLMKGSCLDQLMSPCRLFIVREDDLVTVNHINSEVFLHSSWTIWNGKFFSWAHGRHIILCSVYSRR